MATAVGAGAARAAGCAKPPGFEQAQVQVEASLAQPQYRTDLNRNQLTAMSGKRQSNAAAAGRGHSLGLTYAEFFTQWRIRTFSQRRGAGFCHWIGGAEVTLGMPSLTVYVASEYAPGSCQYNTIKLHENEHVRINQAVVRKFVPILQERLQREIQRINPLINNEPDGRRAAAAALDRVVKEVIAEMYRERDRHNGAIDTRENYERTGQRCDSW